ncbi:hypothetical protein HDV62DRAFT_385447 [Trichoderma sp. SZMC 28011]
MELLEGLMAHKSSFHPAIVPRYSSSLCQALNTGTEGPGRWYGGMAMPKQGSTSTAAVMLARDSNRRFRGNEMAPDRTAAIGQVGFAAGSSIASNATRG